MDKKNKIHPAMAKKEFIERWQPYNNAQDRVTHPNIVHADNKRFLQDLDQLINQTVGEYLQKKLNNYDVGSLEYKIIEKMLKEIMK